MKLYIDTRKEKQDVMFQIFTNCTAAEQVLIAKIIHKHLSFGISLGITGLK